jgi:hypothetical protein
LDIKSNRFKYGKRKISSSRYTNCWLAFGGYTTTQTAATEEYNGTSWTTSPASLATARYMLAGAGTQTAALAFGGYLLPGGNQAATEEWTGPGAALTKTVTVS